MVNFHDAAITSALVVLALLGQQTSASVDDVIAGLSNRDISNILDDLSYLDDINGDGVDQYSPDSFADDDEYLTAKRTESEVKHTSQKQGQSAAASMLPAYCDPPNPCPPGYTSSDGCIEDFENSSEFSRDFQSTQNCICDTEHM